VPKLNAIGWGGVGVVTVWSLTGEAQNTVIFSSLLPGLTGIALNS
jgi:hypothetical protein